MKITLILNNIRSNENVGSIFRTADAAGVSKIILCGYTPAPLDRFGRENKGLVKASLGAEKTIPWQKCENLKEAIDNLNNFLVVGIEQSENSINYTEIKNKAGEADGLALVFGNEVDGLSKEDLELCDWVAELPMKGKKESLNVSVTAGIVLYEVANFV